MKRQQALITLVLVPALVSFAVTMLVLTLLNRGNREEVIVLPTFSATSAGEQPAEAAAPPSETLSPGQPDSTPGADLSSEPAGEASPAFCENPIHEVQTGELLGRIVADYGVTIDEVVAYNSALDPDFDPDLLFVGQEIVIPLCDPETLPTPIADTPTPTNTIPPPVSTATAIPETGDINVVISRVLFAGDITQESVDILNLGGTIDLEDWELRGEARERFVFPAVRLFPNGSITVYTGDGENSASELFWGLDRAIWSPGDLIRLLDADGVERSVFELPAS